MRDYLYEMLDALTSAYSKKDRNNIRWWDNPLETNIGKLFSILAWGLNNVQENADLIKLWDNIDYACGSVLDRYGANFGVKRNGMNDAFYRLAIRVKVLSQLSGGDIETVVNAAAELLDVDLSDVLLNEVFPAKIALFVDQDLLSQERLEMIETIALAIKRILATGVGMRLYLRTYRTYRYDLPISHGGAIGRFYSFQPVGEDRENVLDVPVAYGGAIATEFTYEPVGEDRAARRKISVGHAASLGSAFDPPFMGEDKTFRASVPVAHSGFLPPAITGAMPDSKDSGVMKQSSRGGAYMHSRIKPKRID